MTEQTTTFKSRVFLCYWDCNGFETIADMTAWEKKSFLNTIAGKTLEQPPVSLKMLTLRAQFNPQRNPEIWIFNTDYETTEDDIWLLADADPQALVDMIRIRGKKLYGNTTPNELRIK